MTDIAALTSLIEPEAESLGLALVRVARGAEDLASHRGVPRVVARVNHPGNEWLYNESWGVDVAVSTPRLLSALVEEAVSVGDLVRLMTFGQSEASLVELTMPDDAPLAGQQVGSIEWPADSALVAILREGRVLVPQPEDPLQPGDELFFVTTEDVEEELERLFSAG